MKDFYKEIKLVKSTHGCKKWHIPKELLVALYINENKSQYEIAKELCVAQYVVSARMREYKIKTRPKYNKMVEILKNKQAKLDLKLFDNLDDKVAWFLGWLVSDGHISTNCVVFRLSKKDFEVLQKFRNLLNYTGKLYESVSILNGKSYDIVSLKINNLDLIRKIRDIGITPKNKKIYPNLIWGSNENINKHFIRGIFEGDGSLIFQTNGQIMFEIVGTKELMSSIQEKLISYLELNKTKLTQNKKLKNHFLLRYGGKFQTLRILEWLYNGSEDSYRLDRKFQRYLQLKEYMEVGYLKGVILAGGSGTRLRPLTQVTNS